MCSGLSGLPVTVDTREEMETAAEGPSVQGREGQRGGKKPYFQGSYFRFQKARTKGHLHPGCTLGVIKGLWSATGEV